MHHEKGPSESSSLCVSVDHTAQNSTLSDCHSYFHSHVSSVDSTGMLGMAPPLLPLGAASASASLASASADTPLAATVSALRVDADEEDDDLIRNASDVDDDDDDVDDDDASSSVDYSVTSAGGVATSLGASPKLDFTVTSAVPNTGTVTPKSQLSSMICESGTIVLSSMASTQCNAGHGQLFNQLEELHLENKNQLQYEIDERRRFCIF